MKNNKPNKFLMLTICIFLLVLSVNAKEDSLKIEHTIDSKFPAEKRLITVQLPKPYNEQTVYKYPVLYLLDGQSNLAFSNSVVDFLTENASMPEIIIVAMHSNQNRSRDYLPPNTDKRFSGNASQYLQHIEKELIHFIEKNYRAASFRILSGHSYGGVFVTHAMIEKPDLFKAYITQSPYLDKVIGDPIIERMTKFLEANPKWDGFYYMNIGNEPNLEQNFNKMEGLFKTKASKPFRFYAEKDSKKSHMTTRLIGQYNALENLFVKNWNLSQQEIATGKFAGLKIHIENLSTKYGYPILYSEQIFAQATQIFLSTQDVNSATKTAELFTKQHPKSAIGHFFLAVSYRSSKEKDKAIEAIEKAIKLFEANPKAELKPLYANMKQLQQVLTKN